MPRDGRSSPPDPLRAGSDGPEGEGAWRPRTSAPGAPLAHPSAVPSADTKELRLRARFAGERIQVRAFEQGERVGLHPLTLRVGERGYAVLFRFGAVVLVDVAPVEEAAFYAQLEAFVQGAFEAPERDELDVEVDPDRPERLGANGVLSIQAASLERLQVIAHVLAKSTVLAYYEERVMHVLERIERLAEDLHRGARGPARSGELLRQIGDVLLTQAATVGRVEVTEKPEITWEDRELDRLYEHLSSEYELRDRDLALTRKLELVSVTVETYLDLLRSRQTLRVEWYIVALIAIEIALIVYDLLTR
jgi:uncharacterized Rmd1/YagE family protein